MERRNESGGKIRKCRPPKNAFRSGIGFKYPELEKSLKKFCIRVLVRANVLVPVQSLGAGNLSVGRSEQAGAVRVECVRVRLDAGGGQPMALPGRCLLPTTEKQKAWHPSREGESDSERLCVTTT